MRPRLRTRRQFDLVYTQGRKLACSAVVLFHLENAPDRRVAFVASRKVGIAVERNRAKRLMRTAFAEIETAGPELDGWFVLVARRDIGSLRSGQVADRMRGMLGLVPGAAEPPPATKAEGAAGS